MSNVLSEEKRQQVIALGRLGWPLRRIQQETGIRRETAGAYLKAAGVAIRAPGGWGRRSLNVTPSGRVLPCHAAESIPGLEFWNVREHALADIWQDAPAFQAFRGSDWMQEPCRSCARKEVDFGGCRCQAFLLTGDAGAADPVCHLSPHHADIEALAAQQANAAYEYRRLTKS